MEELLELMNHVNESPTAFHCVNTVKRELEKEGYLELSEAGSWDIKPGRLYYTIRNSSSLIAFSIPKENAIEGFHVFSAHSDSPCFRIKENAEMVFEGNLVRLNVEKYGGMILSSWLDRPLSIAGRVVFLDEDRLSEKLINIDRDLCVIPNVAPHMDSEINSGKKYSAQNDMLPLFGDFSSAGKFNDLIAQEAGVPADDILGTDLFLYAREKGTFLGRNEELLLSPRLDDQACVFAGLKGLIKSKASRYVKVLAVFDNEEVGSQTKQGAGSSFLEDVLVRICESFPLSRSEYIRLISESFNISADNAHAVHPAMPLKADPTSRPFINKGVVLKFSGNQKYTTDAYSAAYIRKLAKDAGIFLQNYSNNSDVAGGSTLGNISTSHVSVRTADIGLAELSMHSSVETMGTKDYKDMVRLVEKYFEG